jgi:hypothetical protein
MEMDFVEVKIVADCKGDHGSCKKSLRRAQLLRAAISEESYHRGRDLVRNVS